jgi:RimJ/RimL family protein N-acetyltransferase
MEIRTDRLLLRPARAQDLTGLHAVFSDPETMRYWVRPAHEDIALTRDFLDKFMAAGDNSFDFIIDLDGQCIGKVGIWEKPEIGYILNRRFWRQGIISEALRAVIPAAFDHFPDMPVMTAELDPRNAGSIRVLESFGFARTGYAVKNFLYGDALTATA